MERTLASTVILKRNKMLGDNTEIEQDENSRVAVETFAAKDTITIAGQITTNAKIIV